MSTLLWFVGALIFIVALLISIGLHEFGHLWVAKKFGLKVPEFMIGFGNKPLWSKTINGTKYGFKAIPLGGYVKILDPKSKDPESAESQLLSNVSPWKRILVFLAGPVVNIAIGTLMFFIIFATLTVTVPTNTVNTITCAEQQECPAKAAGLQPGDQIISIEGTDVADGIPTGLLNNLMKDRSEVSVEINRDGETKTLTVTPVLNADQNYVFGIQLDTKERQLTISESLKGTWGIYERQVGAVIMLPTKVPELIRVIGGGERTEDTPVSVVGATRASGDIVASTIDESSTGSLAGETTSDKLRSLALLIASFNLGIGLINLLPLLPLDGGRILIAGIDSVKRKVSQIRKTTFKPVGMKVMTVFTMIVLVFILAYMGLAFTADIVNPMKI